MLLECLIKRDGPTTFNIDTYTYTFQPRPHLTDGDEKASVCIVNAQDHIDRLLASGIYRAWTPKGKEESGLTRESFRTVTNAPTLKSLIKKCGDKTLLTELGDQEASAAKRPWVLDSINARLDELEG